MPILALRVAVSIVVVIVSTVLPWLPGKYDSLAVPLLALFATIWLAAERWGRAGRSSPCRSRRLSRHGIDRRGCEFQYEPKGDAYNVLFEHLTTNLAARVIVMYNPRDEHVMTSHDSDRLYWSGDDLSRRRGYYSVHSAPEPHWKYFLFD